MTLLASSSRAPERLLAEDGETAIKGSLRLRCVLRARGGDHEAVEIEREEVGEFTVTGGGRREEAGALEAGVIGVGEGGDLGEAGGVNGGHPLIADPAQAQEAKAGRARGGIHASGNGWSAAGGLLWRAGSLVQKDE